MSFFSNAMQKILDRTPDGYRTCYRCSVCRTCLGKGKVSGKPCTACEACKKCDGTRLVPDERFATEDAEVVLTKFSIMKRPMLEHLTMFLANQPEGALVMERLLDGRYFRTQDGEVVCLQVVRRGKKEDVATTRVNIEEPAEVPVEAPL